MSVRPPHRIGNTKRELVIKKIFLGIAIGFTLALANLLVFHYLYTTHFEHIHDEFIEMSSESSGTERSAYYFSSWFVIGAETPPEASEPTSPVSYFIPSLLLWSIVGGVVGGLAQLRSHGQQRGERIAGGSTNR